MADQWKPMSIDLVAERFSGAGVDWWVAGGYAIDMFLGWRSRAHFDLDLEMFRSHSERLFDVFDGWDIHVVAEDRRETWTDAMPLDDDVFGVWIRQDTRSPWEIEIMFADGDTNEWRFRRDPSVGMSTHRLIRRTGAGIPYGTPEAQLLYKSMQARPKDDADLARCLVRMTTEERSWLADAIARTTPGHPWISVLGASLGQQHE